MARASRSDCKNSRAPSDRGLISVVTCIRVRLALISINSTRVSISIAIILLFSVMALTSGLFSFDKLWDMVPNAEVAGASVFLPEGWFAILFALPFAMWFFLGIEELPLAAEETHDPAKDIPRGSIAGMFTLLATALLVLVLNPGVLGAATISESGEPILDGFRAIFPNSDIAALLSLMALAGLAPEVMRPAALVLNLAVASIAVVRFARADQLPWHTLPYFLLGSIPAAYLAGSLEIPDEIYRPLLATVLIAAALRLAVRAHSDASSERAARPPRRFVAALVGGVIGLLAGATGTGGGVFRTPRVIELPADDTLEALMPLFGAIERESRTHRSGQTAAGMSLLTALMVQVARLAGPAARDAGGATTGARKQRQIGQFKALLDRHFREHWPVQSYADTMGLTAGQLSRICREVLGMSALDVINARLVHEAQRELVYTVGSVKQLAAELGFEDDAYFSRFFKRHTGLSPRDFRAQALAQLATTAP